MQNQLFYLCLDEFLWIACGGKSTSGAFSPEPISPSPQNVQWNFLSSGNHSGPNILTKSPKRKKLVSGNVELLSALKISDLRARPNMFATTLPGKREISWQDQISFELTALVGFVSNATGFSTAKDVPLWELLWFSIVANMAIVGINLSLMLNSVGFYQISKLSMIPVVCVMEWVLHNKNYTKEVKPAVFVVVTVVGVCTVTDIKVNLKRFLCAVVAVLCTSLQQISIGSLQKKFSIGSFDVLSKTAPIQAASLLVFVPFIEYYFNGHNLLNYQFS